MEKYINYKFLKSTKKQLHSCTRIFWQLWFRLEVNISFTTYGNCKCKIESFFRYKILNNILFVNKMLFKLRKFEPLQCSLCKAEDETYIHLFYRCCKTSILWRQFQKFFSTGHKLTSILPESVILLFLDDV